MNRRDTIIVAVLVNAALLTILFATAVRSGPDPKKEARGQLAALKKEQKMQEIAAKPKAEMPAKKTTLLDEYLVASPSYPQQEEEILFSFEDTEMLEAEPIALAEELAPMHEVSSGETVAKGVQQYAQVTVKKGDFLEKIAKANHCSVAAIMKANQLTSSQLKIGQVLKIPLSGEHTSKPTAQHIAANHEDQYYIVREGDNPWLIASRNKLKLEELLKLNGLDEQKAKRLRPGDKLKIR